MLTSYLSKIIAKKKKNLEKKKRSEFNLNTEHYLEANFVYKKRK